MLVISRKTNESVIIDDNIEITVLETSKDKIKIGINAPKDVKIKRKELFVTEQANIDASKTISKDTLNMIMKNKERCGKDGSK